MEALARRRDDVTLKVIDIGTWSSPVARQYGIRRLPHLMLYKDGRLVSQNTADVLRRLQ